MVYYSSEVSVLQRLISSLPRISYGKMPFPDLFGESKPIFVLQEIIVGFLAVCAFLKALKISLGFDH